MKRYINFLILFVLCSLTLNAQTLYTTRMDSIPIIGDSVTLKLFEHRGSVQWQRTLDGSKWRNIAGEISDSITIPSSIEAMYRAYIYDDNCFESYSDTSAIWHNLEMNPIRRFDEIEGLNLKTFNDSVCTFEVTGPYELNEGDFIMMPDTTLKKIVYNSKYEINPLKTPDCNKRTLIKKIKYAGEEITREIKEVENLEEVYRNMSLVILYGEEDQSEEYEDLTEPTGAPQLINNSQTNTQSNITPKNIRKLLKLSKYEGRNILIKADNGAEVNLEKLNYHFRFKIQVILKYVDGIGLNVFKLFRKSKLQEFEFSTVPEKTGFFVEMDATATADSLKFPLTEKKLNNLYNTPIVLPGGIPCLLSIDLMASAEGNLNGKISWDGDYSVSYKLGVKWIRGVGFIHFYKKFPTKECVPLIYPMNVNQDLKICFFPRVSLTIYKTIAPYFDYGMYFREDSKVSEKKNYDLKTYYGHKAEFGVNFKFLTFDLKLFRFPFEFNETQLFQIPQSIDFIGSDHRCASANTYFLVKDSKLRPVANCPVYIGDNKLSTDNEGRVIPYSWNKNNDVWDFLTSNATIKDRNDSNIDTKEGKAIDCSCYDKYETFTDNRDGNSYRTLTKDGITWMVDNFKYHPVPLSEMDEGSNNYLQEGKPYFYKGDDGVLYNWHAAQTIAPHGWHLPTVQECEKISKLINSSALGQLNDNYPYYYYNVVFQCSLFTLGGYRDGNLGVYINSGGNWWTSENFSNESANYFNVMNDSKNITIGTASKTNGFSVRFVKD